MKRGKNFKRVARGEEILFLAEEIEIIHPMYEGSLDGQRPGRSYDDVNLMSKSCQFVGQIGKVNSLAAAIGISPITQ